MTLSVFENGQFSGHTFFLNKNCYRVKVFDNFSDTQKKKFFFRTLFWKLFFKKHFGKFFRGEKCFKIIFEFFSTTSVPKEIIFWMSKNISTFPKQVDKNYELSRKYFSNVNIRVFWKKKAWRHFKNDFLQMTDKLAFFEFCFCLQNVKTFL